MDTNNRTRASSKKTLAMGLLMILFIFPACYTSSVYTEAGSQNRVASSLGTTLGATSYSGQSKQLQASQLSPQVETRRVIVILIELSGVSFTKPPSDMNSTVFGSMASYFYNVSYGRLIITGTTTNPWNHVENKTVDYGKDTAGGIDDTDNDGVPDSWKLIRDAVSLLNSSTDFASYDTVMVVHSGQDQAKSGDTKHIWSAYYSGIEIPTNGVIITTGIIISEFDPVGIFAHEFGHSLGLPDLYDENRSVDDFVGPWDLMAEGAWLPGYSGTSPSHPTSWSKLKLGWVSSNLIDVGRNVTGVIDPLEIRASNFTAMKIPITTQTYYLVEVRQHIGYDSSLPSRGVLILYCDESLSSGNGIVKVRGSQSLTDATYTEAMGNNMFVDNSANINITILTKYSLSYKVSIKLIRADHTPPRITIQNAVTLTWPTTQPALVEATITDTGANSSSVKNASVVYSSDGGKSWSRIPMTPGSADFYSALVPPPNSSEVKYYVEAYDYSGNLALANNNGQDYIYGVSEAILILIIVVPVAVILVVSTFLVSKHTKNSRREETQTKTEDLLVQDRERKFQ